MSQPPPGGSPPPDDSPDAGAQTGQSGPGNATTGPQQAAPPPPGAYPPPPGYQQGPPPGYQQGPPPGYQAPPPGYQQGPPPGYQQGPPPSYQAPPPGYQQGPPPGYQAPPPGYQQGPPPGYQQGPPPGYQGPPGQGGYPPPGYGPPPNAPGGYGPPGVPGGYAPPGAYPPPPSSGVSKPSFDASKVTISGWGVLGASALTLIASFFSFWHFTSTGFISASVGLNGWSQWWWIPTLLAIAVGIVYALQLFGVLSRDQVKPEWLVYAAAASFLLMIGVMLQTFFYAGGSGGALSGVDGISYGPSFGVFFALITTAALTYFTALAAQGSGAKLPMKVPGPA